MFMASFNSSNHDQQEEEDPSSDLQYHHQLIPEPSRGGFTSIHIRQLLIRCAELISRSDLSAAHRLVSILSSNSSPDGDSTERLVHQFAKALSLRLNNCCYAAAGATSATATTITTGPTMMMMMMIPPTSAAAAVTATTANDSNNIADTEPEKALQSCYLSLNQITPFVRFSHLTANQAILEAIDEGQQAIHILDFDIMHGLQWPPLMQALAERSYPPPMLRITATGHDLNILHRTGDRLLTFAQSLGLRFQFHPLLLGNSDDPVIPPALALLPDEALAVNCVLYLHRLLKDDSRALRLFLHKIKTLNPKVVTIAEREANHNHPLFLQRFVEALDHYTAVFDSLEATLPPNSRERLTVEQVWFGREIMDIVAAEGDKRRERHERYESWEVMLRSSGFSNVPLSPFALSQAKLLLRLHYPSEGYQLQIRNDSLFLGWRNRALFSVSSWH
ncbi:scarecrow-like protein 18 [Alnus glutinosa]|uniref:scarecrow-like protein 18 n=1 Tax=Alnus glutinosa TaxID=3517 RepID=UPI002D778647|nr:scarecrow-like protein 18 [Alnus glutinosa]